MKLWTCSKCGRKFEKINQSHSCKVYPLENHFKGKEKAKELYNELIKRLKVSLKFRVDSIHCCIHLVKTSTFLAVFPLKDKIRITFALPYKMKNSKIEAYFHASKKVHYYRVEINNKDNIDKELLSWIKEAYKK